MILLELTVAAAVNVLVEKEEEAAAMPAEWNALAVQARITRVYIQSLAAADSYL